jgi:PKD repeat protein
MTTDERNITTIQGQDIVDMAYGGGVWYGVSASSRRLVEVDMADVTDPEISYGIQLPFEPKGVAIANRSGRQGVHRRVYDGEFLRGAPVGSDIDTQVEFSRDSQAPSNAWRDERRAFDIDVNHYSFELDFWYVAPETGDYRFTLASDDGVRVYWDGVLVVQSWKPQQAAFDEPTRQWSATLSRGQAVRVKIEYANAVAPLGAYSMRYHFGANPPPDAVNDPKIPASALFLPYRVSRRVDDPLGGAVGTEILPDIGAAVIVGEGKAALFTEGVSSARPQYFDIPHATGVVHGVPSGQVVIGTDNSLILVNAHDMGNILVDHHLGFTPKVFFTDPDESREVWVISNDGQYARFTTFADSIQINDRGVFEHARDVVDGYAYSPVPAALPDNRLLARYGWIQSPVTRYWYRRNSNRTRWDESQAFAQARGAQLAYFPTQAENDWVATYVHALNSQPKWIGLRNLAYPSTSNNYNWSDEGVDKPLTFTSWNVNQPSAGANYSVYLHNNGSNKWTDRPDEDWIQVEGLMQIKDPCNLTPEQWELIAQDVGVEPCNLASYDWLQSPITGYWYRVLKHGVDTWDVWAAHAEEVGGVLACPPVREENDWLHENVANERYGGGKWIGLINSKYPDDPVETDYVWYNGIPRTYEVWAANQPGPGGGYSGIMRGTSHEWEDRARTPTGNNFRGIVQIEDPSKLTEDQWDAIAADAGKPVCIAPGTRRDTCVDEEALDGGGRTITLVEDNNATALYSLETKNDVLVPEFVERVPAHSIKAITAWGLTQGVDAITIEEFLGSIDPDLDSTIAYPFPRTKAQAVRQGLIVSHAKTGMLTVFHDDNVDPPIGVDFPFFPQPDVEYAFRVVNTVPIDPPVAALTVTGADALVASADASASTAGTNPIATYTFDWGDGSTTGPQASPLASHTYASVGVYTVTVTVGDAVDLEDEATDDVTLDITAPMAVLSLREAAGQTLAYYLRMSSFAGQVDSRSSITEHTIVKGDGGLSSMYCAVQLKAGDTCVVNLRTTTVEATSLRLSVLPGHREANDPDFRNQPWIPGSGDHGWFLGTPVSSAGYPVGPGTSTETIPSPPNPAYTATQDCTFMVGFPGPYNTPVGQPIDPVTTEVTMEVLSILVNGEELLQPFDATGVVFQDDGQGSKPAYANYPRRLAGGTAVTVNGLDSTPGSFPISSYSYDFGDGTVISRGSAGDYTHQYATSGLKTVSLVVTDTFGQSDSDSDTIDLTEGPDAALSVTSVVDKDVNVDASASTAGDNPIATYTFDWGDGNTTGPQASPLASHTYATAGNKTVTVTVTDTVGITSTASATAELIEGPTALLATNVLGAEGALRAYARAAWPQIGLPRLPDGRISTAQTQESSTGGVAYHYYVVHMDRADLAEITLTRTSGYGNVINLWMFHGRIDPTDPGFTNPGSGQLARQLGRTYVYEDGEPFLAGTYTRSFLPAVMADADNMSLVVCMHATTDAYAHTLTAVEIRINNVPLTLTPDANGTVYEDDGDGLKPAYTYFDSIRGGNKITANGVGSTPGTSPIVSWRYDWGDGGVYNASTDTDRGHDYTFPGTYTVTLTVTDANGLTATDSMQVTVEGGTP